MKEESAQVSEGSTVVSGQVAPQVAEVAEVSASIESSMKNESAQVPVVSAAVLPAAPVSVPASELTRMI